MRRELVKHSNFKKKLMFERSVFKVKLYLSFDNVFLCRTVSIIVLTSGWYILYYSV